MNKRSIRRALALAGAAVLCLVWAAPAFAEKDSWQDLQQMRLWPQWGTGETGVFSGAEVAEDGSVLLAKGRACSLTWQSSFEAPQNTKVVHARWGLLCNTGFSYQSGSDEGYEELYNEYLLLESDGQTATFARPAPGSEVSVLISFRDLKLAEDACFDNSKNYTEMECDLIADAQAQVRCTVDAVITLPLPQGVDINGRLMFADQQAAKEFRETLIQAMEDPGALLPQPEEAVLTMTHSGRISGNWGNNLGDEVQLDFHLGWPAADSEGEIAASWEFQGKTLQVTGLENTPFGLSCVMVSTCTDYSSEQVAGVTATRAVATTGGAAALGLFGGAAANGLSTVLDSLPAGKRREDAADPDEPDEAPDLPQQDTPSVSMSFYRPFDDLVNTRGAAVDIQLTISGGEGLHWNYIPTAVCPGGLKAVVPAVVGNGPTATLVLTLTGAAMEKPHLPVFLTVVAWAAGPGGTVKTTGTLEVQLHRPGLEAARKQDGSLEVTLYADGNLDGVAEKVALGPGQYTCARQPDGSLLIEAKPPYKGSCRLEAPEQEG